MSAAAIGVLLQLGIRVLEVPIVESAPTMLVLWLAMVTVAAVSPVPVPRAQITVTPTPALEFAGMLLFGPLVGCWIAALSRLVTHAGSRWSPLPASLTDLSQAILAVAASGATYLALGGKFGAEVLGAADQLLPLAAAAAAYLAVHSSIAGAYAALSTPRTASVPWWISFGTNAGMQVILLPFGVLLALTELRIGAVGVALFLLPLLLARYSFRLWQESKAAHLDTVRTLMAAMDAADPFTWGLSYRVSKMSVRVGRELGLSGPELEELEYAALLHDIGRTAIKREILLKPGRLDAKEQAALGTHPRVGRDILSRLRFFPGAPEIVHAHHEQPDGKGYPRGLRGDDIPMGSRIIMVVGAFDAMTSDRPYRRGLSPDAAFEELLHHAGTQFFPDVAEVLIDQYVQGRLFEDFDEANLAAYAGTQGNSRAIEEHLRRTGSIVPLPVVLDTRSDDGPTPEGARTAPSLRLVESLPVEIGNVVSLDREGTLRLHVAGRSDVGCVRNNNEDSFGVFVADDPSGGCLLVLADGMGGAAAGEVASRLAVESVRESFLGSAPADVPQESLRAAIEQANRSVHERSASESAVNGMGTTLTAARIRGQSLVVGHVGDSRAYLVRGNSIEQLTADHTLAAELEEMGEDAVSASERASHVLTRCLGNESDVEVDVTCGDLRLEDSDQVVLCSDGLSGLVDETEILQIVRAAAPDDACRELVELARARGGPDNITVLVGQLRAA